MPGLRTRRHGSRMEWNVCLTQTNHTWLWIYDEDVDNSMSTMRPGKPGAVPLYYATMLGFRDLAEYLITEHLEHVNARGGRQETPMHVAAWAGHVDILSLLLEHGANIDVYQNLLYHTPLIQASMKGKLEAGQYLLDRGADINVHNKYNRTPLFMAVFYGHVEFVQMLLKRGAKTNTHDTSFGNTPLHWAAQKRNIQVVRWLLEHGADVNVRNNERKTPSQWTSDHEIMELLSKYGFALKDRDWNIDRSSIFIVA